MGFFSFLSRSQEEGSHAELQEDTNSYLYDGVSAEKARGNICSRIQFLYMAPVVEKAQKHTLEAGDLPPLMPDQDPFHYLPKAVAAWEVALAQVKYEDWNIFRKAQLADNDSSTKEEDLDALSVLPSSPTKASMPRGIYDHYLEQATPPPSGIMDHYTYKRRNLGIPLLKTYAGVLWRNSAILGSLMFLESLNRFSQTFIVHDLINTVKNFHDAKSPQEADEMTQKAWILAMLMILSSLIGAICLHWYMFFGGLLGLSLRQCNIGMVHRKLLKLHNRAFQITTPGQINNLITSDVSKFDRWTQLCHVLWIAPFQQSILAYIMHSNIGTASTCVGIGTLILLMPQQSYMGTVFGRIRSTIAAATDKRMKVVREVLQGIKIIKMYGWEEPYKERILQLRKNEVLIVLKSVGVRAFNQALVHTTTGLVTMVTLLTFKATGGVFTAENVFTTTLLLGVAKRDLSLRFSGACECTSEMLVSLRRISDFLILPEVENREMTQYSDLLHRVHKTTDLRNMSMNMPVSVDLLEHADTRYFLQSDPINGLVTAIPASNEQYKPIPDHLVSITIENVTAIWPKSMTQGDTTKESKTTLQKTSSNNFNSGSGQLPLFQNISLKIQGAKLVAVVGRIASGKSSFLQLLLHEMEALSGKVDVQGSVAYVSQQSWLFNGSIKENIICGKEYACIGENISGSDTELGENVRVRRGGDEWMYSCIHACALPIDLELMQHGVHTGVGESGASLSGGQRARVALCRALYSDADVYLIDDVFAPLDRRSTRWVYEDAIKTLLKDKLVILATHHTEVVNDCDYVVWTCPPGYIHKCGPIPGVEVYGNIIHGKPEDLVKIPEFKEMLDAGVIHGSGGGADDEPDTAIQSTPFSPGGMEEARLDDKSLIVPSVNRTSKNLVLKKDVSGTWVDKTGASKVVTERREIGGVGWGVFLQYISAFGGLRKLLMLSIVSLLVQCVVVGADLWLVRWVKADKQKDTGTTSHWTYVYVILIVLAFPFVLLRASSWLKGAVVAARRLHNSVLDRVIGGVTSWFEARPIGQTLNRFGADTHQMDEAQPSNVADLVSTGCSVMFTVLVVSMQNWPVLFVLIPIGITFYFLRKRYMQVSQQVKRLESMSKSPMYTSFSNCMDGLTVIRNIPQLSPRIHGKFLQALRKNSSMFVPALALTRWFTVRLDCLSVVFIGTTVIMAVVLMKSISSEAVGLSLSYVLQLLGSFQWCIRLTTELENTMVSVERVVDLKKVPQERQKVARIPTTVYDTEDKQLRKVTPEEAAIVEEANPTVSVSADKRLVFNSTLDAKSTIEGVWPPNEGNLLFYNASMRYAPAPNMRCLDRLNCYIPAGSKVGIVGRTGAGKSSIMNMLMRIVEMEDTDRNNEGTIVQDLNYLDFDQEVKSKNKKSHVPLQQVGSTQPNIAQWGVFIDGVDISALGLHQLRNSLAIIPQDPVLFSGTVRSNLDPFGYFDDQALIRALQKAQLYDTFFNMPYSEEYDSEIAINTDILENSGLHTIITEAGGNLSQGTRQLLCLGRALTNEEAKVVILDECTASVDHVTDGIVQDVVRTQLKHCTLLIVAHRVQTIIDADYIIVMDKGCLVEFGSPHELLQMQGGIFADVVDKGGAETALALRSQAEECFKMRHPDK